MPNGTWQEPLHLTLTQEHPENTEFLYVSMFSNDSNDCCCKKSQKNAWYLQYLYIFIYAAMGEVNPPHEVPVSSLPKCGIAFCGLLRLLVQVR